MAISKTLTNDVVTRIIAQLPGDASPYLRGFTQQFYAKLPPADAASIDPAKAAMMATSAVEFIMERKAGVPKIRIFTPDKKTYGWKTQRTIIEILNDDMPFLVDSVTAEIARQNLRLFELIHPILTVKRAADGTLQSIGDEAENTQRESLIHLEVANLPDELSPEKLKDDLLIALQAVRLSVEDWQDITQKAETAITDFLQTPQGFDAEDTSEIRHFLRWMLEKNFIFLGYIEYDFYDRKGKQQLSIVEGSERGLFKLDDFDLKPKGLEAIPKEMLHFALQPQLAEITKSNRKSLVHRPVHMDYVGLKRFDKKGKVIGEARFLGLFTSTVYYQSADQIPLIRRKIARTQARANFDPLSHDGKALKAILEFYPRDELFQISEDDLYEFSLGLLALEAKPTVKLFARKDVFERFLSCMVYIPRERFSTYYREQIQSILEQAFSGSVTAYYTQVTDSPLARLQIILKTTPGQIPEVDSAAIERSILQTIHLWTDVLWESVNNKYDEKTAETLYKRYSTAFPKSYINMYDASNAVHDIEKIEQARLNDTMALELFQLKSDDSSHLRLKTFNPRDQIPLSDLIPMLENLGFKVLDENPFLITPPSNEWVMWMREFRLSFTAAASFNLASIKPLLEQAFSKVWVNEMESDGFNALVTHAGLTWREVTLLRAYGKYLKQINFPYSQTAIEKALTAHPHISRQIVALFESLFNPERQSTEKTVELREQMEAALADVSNLVDDRILRRYIALIDATLRTNYYQRDTQGHPKSYLSLKFASAQVPELPLPRPYAEIFVYSMRVEGIHLRGGKVARGGLRWSDRREDFRTEVLGLVKAQMVKNAVIVPVGSKGGFVLKAAPPTSNREAFMAEGVECYKTFLRGLLDLTDNIVAGNVVPPAQTIRRDEDDPYLVVAADKGTASFSDYANTVSKEYGFWLGDAFASGGSAGYDHKKMAITARGGWVSVTRHFHEMGVDISKEDFTTAGIGDMAGDVFGNGMLLSDHIQLIAAFNHMHIFIDPTPDAKKSFTERQRLFNLPRSSWADYNSKLISKGGGIFERSAKSITLSNEARAALGITSTTPLSPDELIRSILTAPVDLLWNGGIGTYVKAEDESHEQVGDRVNNPLRINGRDLRCKIVGEGGNLGFTQKGRIEYARTGGRINTDAIDNSAGVDCSDHEVNIKIALGQTVMRGDLTLEKRDEFLASMTDEVAYLVLLDNHFQTQAISFAELQGYPELDAQARLMHTLERQGLLDRNVEFLPSDKMLVELHAKKQPLTRPELAVLLAYSKMALYRDLLSSTLPDDSYFSHDLLRYFPKPMRTTYATDIETHPLRREIIATAITNSIVNRTGITLLAGIAEDTGMHPSDVARAYTLARDAFGLRDLWKAIEEAEASISAETRTNMLRDINRFLSHVTLWFLHNASQPIDITRTMEHYAAGIQQFSAHLQSLLSPALTKAFHSKQAAYEAAFAPTALAQKLASLEALSSACDIVSVSQQSGLPIDVTGKVYFDLGARLKLGWLRLQASRIMPQSHWDRQATNSIINQFYDLQRKLTMNVVKLLCDDQQCSTGVESWVAQNEEAVARYDRFMQELRALDNLSFPMLTVALRHAEGI